MFDQTWPSTQGQVPVSTTPSPPPEQSPGTKHRLHQQLNRSSYELLRSFHWLVTSFPIAAADNAWFFLRTKRRRGLLQRWRLLLCTRVLPGFFVSHTDCIWIAAAAVLFFFLRCWNCFLSRCWPKNRKKWKTGKTGKNRAIFLSTASCCGGGCCRVTRRRFRWYLGQHGRSQCWYWCRPKTEAARCSL